MPRFTGWSVTAQPDRLDEVRRRLEAIDFHVTETTGLEGEILIGTGPEDAQESLQAIEGVEKTSVQRISPPIRRTAGRINGDCNICLSSKWEAYPEEWMAILIHEMTHCNQYRCRQGRRGPNIGPKIPIPTEFPPPNCGRCKRSETEAYRRQCKRLFADEVSIQRCIAAGVCYSRGAACAEERGFADACDRKKFPSYYPLPLPDPGIGLV